MKWAAYNPATGQMRYFATAEQMMEWHNTLGDWLLMPKEEAHRYDSALRMRTDEDGEIDYEDDDEDGDGDEG